MEIASDELVYRLALTTVPNVGVVQARILLEKYKTAGNVFKAPFHSLIQTEGVGEITAQSIRTFKDFSAAHAELQFLQREGIGLAFITDEIFPQRLLNCYDAPILLFYKGDANLNPLRTIGIIGTRNHSGYGREMTEQLVAGLAAERVQVISGLAHGIDGIAHQSALTNGLSTIGVLAHGLDLVYPSQHRALANEMIHGGGALVTEFPSRTLPDRHNFPTRNRIVAGMSDAIIVVETHVRGGSMITAELANGYNKDVFAFPGKVTDARSMGCNLLIRKNKAQLITDVTEVIELMNWNEKRSDQLPKQAELFIALSAAEQQIISVLDQHTSVSIDDLNHLSGLTSGEVAAAILSLELQNLVLSLPGKMYQRC